MQSLKKNIDLILILLFAFALRFSISVTHSYTNDELSAINRLRFNVFDGLIETGVKTGDMHPAGVQVFEKIWSSVFGTSEMALRLPFVIFGVISVYLIFLIGKNWFNRQAGIIAAILLSFLYFPIVQSELARPYSPGLMIALITAWLYFKVLFSENKKILHAIFLGVSFAAGMYTHYFLFLFLVWMGFTGLFFLKKDNYKLYLLAATIAILLFLPHIQITLYHLSTGGLGWLGKPDNTFLFDFIFYAFNESVWIISMLFLFLLLSYFFQKENFSLNKKYYLIAVIWFFGIYFIGHLVSMYSTPVLKYPVMLFAFPFLLLIISANISRIKNSNFLVIPMALTLLVSTFFEKKLFGDHHNGFKETASLILQWQNEYGEENIYSVYNVNNVEYLNFYAQKSDQKIEIEWPVIEFSDAPLIRKELSQRQENFCIVGYSEKLTLPQVFEIALEFYPVIVDFRNYDNASVFLLSKNGNSKIDEQKKLIGEFQFDASDENKWTLKKDLIRTDNSGQKIYVLSGEEIYGPDFKIKKSNLNSDENFYLFVEVSAQCDSLSQLTVAVTAERNNEPLYHHDEIWWLGYDLEEMLLSTADQNKIGSSYFAFEVPDFIKGNDDLKISLWNRNGKPINIFSFRIYSKENIWRVTDF